MNRRIIPLVIVVSSMAFMAEVRAFSLKDAMDLAYANNPALMAEQQNVYSAKENIERTRADFRPSVTLTLRGGVERNYSSSRTKDAYQSRIPRSAQVALTQKIYDGGLVAERVNYHTMQARIAEVQFLAKEQDLLYEVAMAYLGVLRTRTMAQLRQKNEQVLTSHYGAMQERFEVGQASHSDVVTMQARLATARAQYITAKSNVEIASSTYEKVVGVAPSHAMTLPDMSHVLPTSLKEAMNIARQETPRLLVARQQVKLAQSNTQIVENALLPSVNLVLSMARNDAMASEDSKAYYAKAEVVASMNLYRGGADKSAIRTAKIMMNKSEYELRQAEMDTQESISKVWQELEGIRAEEVAWRASVRATGLALQGIKDEADVGMKPFLDVLDREKEVLEAEVNLSIVVYNKILAVYALVKAMGRLTAKDLSLSGAQKSG